MFGAVVEDFDAFRRKHGQARPDVVRECHAGKTCRNGLTVTEAKTPSVT
jgi:hypothetical protein